MGMRPYKSPNKLPSVSPILKSLGPMTIETYSTNSRKQSQRKDSEISGNSENITKVKAFDEIEINEDDEFISKINSFVDKKGLDFWNKGGIFANLYFDGCHTNTNEIDEISLLKKQENFWKNIDFSLKTE